MKGDESQLELSFGPVHGTQCSYHAAVPSLADAQNMSRGK